MAEGGEDVPGWLMAPWRAWHRLTDDRPWLGGGMAAPIPGRIPWTAVARWAEVHGLDLEFLDHCIAAMDGEFLDHHAKGRATS